MLSFEKLKLYLSSRFTSVIIILFSFAGRALQVIRFSSIADDRAFQLLAAKNFAAGNGITTYEVFASDLSAPHYIPLVKWPPGYSVLLSPFYSLCGERFLWGSLLLDIIAAVLLVWFARKIMMLFNLPVYLVNLYTLVTGFFMYGFCTVCSTDLLGALFYEMALYFTLLFILSDKKKYGYVLLISFILFLGGTVRYLLIPVAFVIPLYFIGYGFFRKNKYFVSRGLFMTLMVTFFIACLLIFQKLYGGTATYVAQSGKGFYPDLLLQVQPFIFSSFINTDVLYIQLERISGLSYEYFAMKAGTIHLFVMAGALALIFFWFKKKKRKPVLLYDHFVYIGIFSSVVVIALLMWLSATNAPIPLGSSSKWTFVAEARYFFIPVFFIQQLIFIATWHYRLAAKKWLSHFFTIIMIAFFVSVVHDIYFTAKISVSSEKKSKNVNLEYYRDLLYKMIKENTGKNIVSASTDEANIIYAALWENIPGLRDCSNLNTLKFDTKKETIVFVTLRQSDLDTFKNFITNSQTKLVGKINQLYFYTINVSPHIQ
jgi:hypothetical protein